MNFYAWKMRAPRYQCFSHQMNNRQPWQLKKSKCWGPFWSSQLDHIFLKSILKSLYLLKFLATLCYHRQQGSQSVTDIKKSYCNIWFFCKNEACVNCGTHKRHNANLITDSVLLGCATLLQKWGHARMPQHWTHWMSLALLGLLALLPTRKKHSDPVIN